MEFFGKKPEAEGLIIRSTVPEYILSPAVFLNEWTVENAKFSFDGFFSPSGRLFFEQATPTSLRVTDLLAGNYISVECPELEEYSYLPLTEFGGILHGKRGADQRFMSATLDISGRKLVAHVDGAENILDVELAKFFRLSDSSFACLPENGFDEPDYILIRQIDDKEPNWQRIENDFFGSRKVMTMTLDGNTLYIITVADTILMYNIASKSWSSPAITGIEQFETRFRPHWCFGNVLVTDWYGLCDGWYFLAFDVVRKQISGLMVPFPKECAYPYVAAVSTRTEFGIIGVAILSDDKSRVCKYQTHCINIRMDLAHHFKLLGSGKTFRNLPPNDSITPYFGGNNYRQSEEGETSRCKD